VAGLVDRLFIVERPLLHISGIGRYFVQSISDRDYTMSWASPFFFGVFVVVCNLVVDILLP
jgi:oligopeptide transport system permease protein